MYLSSLLVRVGDDPDRPRPGRLWLRNTYHVHQRLCMAFPSATLKSADPDFLKPYDPAQFARGHVHSPRAEDQGFLFRIDPRAGGSAVILVQSAVEPDWDYAFHNAWHLLEAPPQVAPYSPVFQRGLPLRFRLLANPTRKVGTISKAERERLSREELAARKGRHGRRVPVPAPQLLDWLEQRAERSGFALEPGTVTIQSGYLYMKKPGQSQGQRLRAARYDGLLVTTDPDALYGAVCRGIGPGKAFGFGLLSLIPITGTHGRGGS